MKIFYSVYRLTWGKGQIKVFKNYIKISKIIPQLINIPYFTVMIENQEKKKYFPTFMSISSVALISEFFKLTLFMCGATILLSGTCSISVYNVLQH